MLKSSSLIYVNATLLGINVFADVIKKRSLEWFPIQYDCDQCPFKRRKLPSGQMLRDDRGRD